MGQSSPGILIREDDAKLDMDLMVFFDKGRILFFQVFIRIVFKSGKRARFLQHTCFFLHSYLRAHGKPIGYFIRNSYFGCINYLRRTKSD
jgi:hypothetical protein